MLLKKGIKTIGQLASKQDIDLLHIKNFGMRSLQEVREALDALSTMEQASTPIATVPQPVAFPEELDIPETEPDIDTQEPGELQIITVIERLLCRIPERERHVLTLRYGLYGGEGCTLEAVGQELRCTRERVRQIEQRAFRLLQSTQNYPVIHPVVQRLVQAIATNCGVLSCEAAQEALVLDSLSEPIPAESLLAFVLNFAYQVKKMKRPPILVLQTEPYTSWSIYTESICKLLERILTTAYAPMAVDAVLAQFTQEPDGKEVLPNVPEKFIIACLRAHPEIVVDEEEMCHLKKWSNKRVDDIIVVLREHSHPLHYKEIAERVNQRLPEDQQTTAHNVHAQLGRMTNFFVRVGHGIFGLAEWGLVQDGKVADAAYRILSETGHALEIEQLTDKVLETWHVRRTSVRAAIDLDDRFVQVGRNLYWLAGQSQEQGDQTVSTNFDTIFGESLLKRQQELHRIGQHTNQTDTLEDLRRLGTDLLK